jgi:hypothetical protein
MSESHEYDSGRIANKVHRQLQDLINGLDILVARHMEH